MSFFQIILRMALFGFIAMFIIISLCGCNTNHCAQRFDPEDARYQCLNCWVVAYMDDNTTYWYTTDQRHNAHREWRRRTGHRLDEVPMRRYGFNIWHDGIYYHITQVR